MTDNTWLGWDDLGDEAQDLYEKRWIEDFMNEMGCDKFTAELQFEHWLNTEAQYHINFAGRPEIQ